MNKKLAKNIREQRLNTGLTQKEAAEKAGTNERYFGKLERGEVLPSVKMLERVCKALNCKSSDLLPF